MSEPVQDDPTGVEPAAAADVTPSPEKDPADGSPATCHAGPHGSYLDTWRRWPDVMCRTIPRPRRAG